MLQPHLTALRSGLWNLRQARAQYLLQPLLQQRELRYSKHFRGANRWVRLSWDTGVTELNKEVPGKGLHAVRRWLSTRNRPYLFASELLREREKGDNTNDKVVITTPIAKPRARRKEILFPRS